jgi:hypothetical protein
LTFDLFDKNDHRRRPLFEHPAFADTKARDELVYSLTTDTGAEKAGKGTRVTVADVAQLHPVERGKLVEAIRRLAAKVCRVAGK